MKAARTTSACFRTATENLRVACLGKPRILVLGIGAVLLIMTLTMTVGRAAVVSNRSAVSLPRTSDPRHTLSYHARRGRPRHRRTHRRVTHGTRGAVAGTRQSTRIVVGVEGTVGANAYQPDT